ncbi:type II toxin-antitoxin system Phd/YefM family antitoxin [Cellulomonas sp. NPDC057328]|uniref:type II toxin-antitoxin system Phd/YefM family antitoxin n=1 Tax=Cellulomonas sp. NPDC057328 TaxID=3346101 RepID=UPI00362FEB8A
MTTTMNVQDAKARLSDLIARAEEGEDVVIARAGRPVVRLVPVQPRRRVFGTLRLDVPPTFDEPLDEAELAAWE